MQKIWLEAKIIYDLSVKILLLKEKIIFKSHLIKSDHRVLRKNKVYTYGATV
jgi:hypothetical protein